MLAGREDLASQLADWLRSEPSSCTLCADTLEEAIIFLASVIENFSEEEQSYFFPRCLVVSSSEAWRQIYLNQHPLVLIPTFPGANVSPAVSHGHHVLVPGGSEPDGRGNIFELPKLSSRVAADEFHKMGFGIENVHAEARLARRSLQAFRRDTHH